MEATRGREFSDLAEGEKQNICYGLEGNLESVVSCSLARTRGLSETEPDVWCAAEMCLCSAVWVSHTDIKPSPKWCVDPNGLRRKL